MQYETSMHSDLMPIVNNQATDSYKNTSHDLNNNLNRQNRQCKFLNKDHDFTNDGTCHTYIVPRKLLSELQSSDSSPITTNENNVHKGKNLSFRTESQQSTNKGGEKPDMTRP